MHRELGEEPHGRRPVAARRGKPLRGVQRRHQEPSQVRPEAITVMRELGIDISGHRSKSVDEFTAQSFDYVLTVCDNAKKAARSFRPKLL
jgi:protein-tyrosine-phosphatase